MNTIFKKVTSVTMIVSIFLTGCASMQAPEVAIDPNDPCERYRQPLRQAEEEQRNALAQAVFTAILGGIVTFLACRAAGGKNKQCIAPAGGVTVIGTLIGVQGVEAGKQATQADLLRGIDKSSAAFNRRLGNLGSAAHGLHQCRQQQIYSVKSRYQKGRIDRQTAKGELAGIETKLSGDQQLINALLDQNHQLVYSQLDAKATAMDLPPRKRDEYIPPKSPPRQLPGPGPVASHTPPPPPPPRKISKPKDDTQKVYNAAIDLHNNTEADRSKTEKTLKEVEALIG